MDTKQLIENLSVDLKNPSESKDWSTQYWFTWISCFSILAIFTYVVAAAFPADIHLPDHLRISFWLESGVWLSIAMISAFAAYQNSKNSDKVNPLFGKVAGLLSLILVVSLYSRWSPIALAQEISVESHLMQGPCGIFIGFASLFASLWMFFVIRRGAPVRLGSTAAWATASVGCLASMFMHLVCTHESSVHIFVWHVVPLVSLILVLSAFSKRLLRW